MNAEERQVIDGIFDRLKTVAAQPRDAEAEKHIADRIREQPYAPYALAQSVYVQEQALIGQQAEIERLKVENAQLQQRAEAAPQGGGFLSGLFGGGQRPADPREMPGYGQRGQGAGMQPGQPMAMQPGGAQGGPWGGQQPAQAGPWGQQQQPPQQRQGMGFLGTAAAAAAGVAGGMMIGNILSSALGGGGAQAAPSAAPNNFFGQQDQHAPHEEQSQHQDHGYQDDPGDGGFGFDDGGDSYDV